MACEGIVIETSPINEVIEVGVVGPQGPQGVGVPTGGITGYVLAKKTSADYDTEWIFNSGGGGGDLSNPPPIGDQTPNTGAFTNLSAVTGSITTISAGQLTAITGFFTTISASGIATLPHIHGSLAGNLYIHVKNTSGGTLAKGTPVYITGNVGGSDRVEVAAADFDDAAKMPAVGLLETELAQNGEGNAVIVGELTNVNTAAYSLNTELYVGNNGTLTATAPVLANQIKQSVGIVSRVQTNTGIIVVNMQGELDTMPNAHAAAHASAGSDPLFDQDLNTTNDVSFGLITINGIQLNGPQSGSGFPFANEVRVVDTITGAGEFYGDFVAADNLTANRTYDLPDASGVLALTSDIPANTIASTIVDAKGDLIVGTAADTVARLPVGATNGHVLTVDSAEAGGMKWAAASGGGVTGAASSASDVLGVSGSDITGVDANADRIIFWDDSASALKYLEAGSGLSISGTTLTATATGTIGGSTGSTDNVILRSDGTGGSTLQQSGLIVEDVVRTFTTVTGDAAADTITITGSGFESGQGVRFTSLTGGSGLNTTTNYFVVNPSGDTFQVSTTLGGSPSLFTTNITAATLLTGASTFAHVALSQNTPDSVSSLVLRSKGGGATCRDSSGNARGTNAVDWQSSRVLGSQVASGVESFIAAGQRNTASASQSFATNWENTASGVYSFACNEGNTASAVGAFVTGQFTTASGSYAASFGVRSLANRTAIQAYASGRFAATGDAQRIRAVLRNKTTSNTAVELFMGTDTNVRFAIASGGLVAGIINCVGVKSDGTAVAHYVRQFAIKNVAGTTSEVYAAATIGTDNAASTTISVEANDTNDALRINVTGIASETWRWVASVDAVEVAYGT